MLIHIVNPFEHALGGSERAALELYTGLRERAEVRLWSVGLPDIRLADFSITQIQDCGPGPEGGTLIILGNYFQIGDWIESARPERLILNYNTVVGPSLKYSVIDRLRRVADLEIVYESPLVRDAVAIPGAVFLSHIDLDAFAPAAAAPDSRFVVGRLSRDEPYKHHPSDPALYRRLAAENIDVRIMGGTCLRSALQDEIRVTLLPAGAQPAPRFLQGLDCFLYRTSSNWTEAGGRVVFEAMACGLPVVCHARGGYAAYIEHEVNGFVFEGDDDAFQAVSMLQRDPVRRRAIGQAARRGMELLFANEGKKAFFDFFLQRASGRAPRKAGVAPRRIDFAWELGAHTGHIATLLPVARAMQSRGHEARFLLREIDAGRDLEGASEVPRIPAPIWVGPSHYPNPRNFAEILHNFGYHDPAALRQLTEAWRERLAGSRALIASVAPAAHIAARTLGIPSFEISQGFHIPPPTLPSPLLRDWLSVPRAELEAADRTVLSAINSVLAAYGTPLVRTIGELFLGRSMLLTYPELDIYIDRGPAEYFGIPRSVEGKALPAWPAGGGPKVFAYLYSYFSGLERLFDALAGTESSTLALCRGVEERLRDKYRGTSVFVTEEPMAASNLLDEADMVICHASHQMSAQALLAGKPVLLLPTQLEQFLITRRIVLQGMGLGIASEETNPDFAAALTELRRNQSYALKARAFAARYANHDRGAALATMIARCEAALKPRD